MSNTFDNPTNSYHILSNVLNETNDALNMQLSEQQIDMLASVVQNTINIKLSEGINQNVNQNYFILDLVSPILGIDHCKRQVRVINSRVYNGPKVTYDNYKDILNYYKSAKNIINNTNALK